MGETAKSKIPRGPRRGSLSSLNMVSELKIACEEEKDVAPMTESDYFPSDCPSDTDQRRRSRIKYNLRNLKAQESVNVRRSKRLQNQKKEEEEDALLKDEVVKRKKRKSGRKRKVSEIEDDDDVFDYFG